MKTEALKKIIKEAVREAIQEELKEVLLEAVKAPKAAVAQPIQESITSTTPPPVIQTPKKSLAEQRKAYMDIIGETGLNMNSSHAQGFGRDIEILKLNVIATSMIVVEVSNDIVLFR